MKRKTVILAFVIQTLGCSLNGYAEYTDIPVGSWRTHFSYNTLTEIETTPSETFAVANGKLFSFDLNQVSTIYTPLSGLSGFDVAFINWSEQTQELMVCYSDGNFDFLNKGSVKNVPDFKNKPMTADKSVYSVRIKGSTAFVSTGVGLLLLDLERHEISELFRPLLNQNPYSIQETVTDAASLGDSLFLATPAGLFGGDWSDNLHDPSMWKPVSFFAEKPVNIVNFKEKLVVMTEMGRVYIREGNSWSLLHTDSNALRLLVDGGKLILCGRLGGTVVNDNGEKMPVSYPTYDVSFSDSKQLCYVASGKKGLLSFNVSTGFSQQPESVSLPTGPSQSAVWNGFVKNGDFFAVPGGRWGDRFLFGGDVMRFDGQNWTGLTDRDSISSRTGMPFMDIMNLAVDPFDDTHFFLTSWGEGLYEFKNDKFYTLHNQYNSPLISVLPGPFCRVDGAVFDKEGNLWLLNSTYGVSSVLSDTTIWVMRAGKNEWVPMYYSTMPGAPTWGSILFTSTNQIWCNSVRGASYGLFVIDQRGTPWQTSDDRTRWINTIATDDETISPFTYNCMVEDKNGTIWIGTNLGPVLASDPSQVFDPGYTFTRIKVPRKDGTDLADYLLKGIRINSIAVDGANRKWLGTAGNGVYLVSADGLETIHQFNTDNSPLPSNYIFSVTVHPQTGEVFIGTNEGLVSYRAEATEGQEDFSEVRVFPNPVKPGYAGLITVTGLKEGSQVKISDLNGNVLVAGNSLGGQFTWNGLNRQGNRVASGVYLVFSSSLDGTEHQVSKFMVLH